VALPHRREAFLARARDIFTQVEARAELRRLERFEASTRASLPPGAGAVMPPPAMAARDARMV
jgi:adenylate cyclase